MHRHRWLISSALLLFSSLAFAEDIAPGGTLRAAYLANNPAQSVRDPVSGEIRGASADLARELARRRNVPLEFMPLPNPPAVIEAVTKGDADIARRPTAHTPRLRQRRGTAMQQRIIQRQGRADMRQVRAQISGRS